jgi:hypothetical protein
MDILITLIEKLFYQFPCIAVVLILYFLVQLTLRYCEMSHILEIENIRNQHQKDMFDRNIDKERSLLKMKNEHDLEILKEKKI